MQRTLPRRLLVIATVLAWITGVFVEEWHQRTVRHVVCARHGDVVEVGQAPAGDDKPGIYAATPDGHRVCSMPVPAPARPQHPPEFALLADETPRELSPLARLPGARAPPLRYAPKTSPPVI